MRWSDLSFDPSRKVLAQFGAIASAVAGGIAVWRIAAGDFDAVAVALIAAALVLALAAWLAPAMLRPLFVGMSVAAFPVGWLVSRAALAVVFYGLLTPMAIVFRLRGRDLLGRKRSPSDSYWVPREPVTDLRSYLRQF